ncbi:MAG: MBL fold metallo-hydrolase [Alphaproteobacteria bacterium]|nr:MBL fold metallo-hydrolase [Alphaproteobacteria bacterium]MDP7223487.1 MBL fold metallo-hydrolase [Alphaproteobacteria bacterium]
MKLTFMGATGTVTGSKYLLEDGNKRILVDCGLFQGLKELRLRNWKAFPVDPGSIDSVLLTHAHIDHSGYLPLLVKNGFKGKIYCTEATYDLCRILLPDCGRIQESDAERANRYGYTKHSPAQPLYTEADAYQALKLFKTVPFGKDHFLSDFLRFNINRAGHILGAGSIKVSDGQTSILFSGDLGRPHDPIMKAPVQVQDADYLVLESTYGDRLHEGHDPMEKMADIINRTVKRGGIVIIPSFAVGRAQLILYYVHELIRQKKIPKLPVYLDSPMAIDATKIWQNHVDEHRLDAKKCGEVCRTAKYTQTVEESKALDTRAVPAIVISASGMATGGRVLHHIARYIGDEKNTILFAGYQAAGTRGSRLVHGEKEIKLFGRLFPVRAEINNLNTLSAHADYAEILDWLRGFREAPRKTFLTHGEPEAASSFKFKIEEHLGWNVEIPTYMEQVEL